MYYTQDSLVFYNGEFRSPLDVHINPYSQSLHYGNGVFEGIRAYNTHKGTQLFKAKEHFDRLLYGASLMSIPVNYSSEELVELTYELLEKNGLKDAYIRPLITTGADMSLMTSVESSVTIQCWSWGKYMGDKLLKVKTSSYQRPNPKSCFVDAKITGYYTNSILATNEAKQSGYDEALLLDIQGFVAEASGANVFMEKDGVLFTPKKGNIMPGITRSTIMDICKDEEFKIYEEEITLDELKQADSVFFTGTAAEVVGLQSLDDHQFPLKWEQSLGYKLMHLYKQEVLCERTKQLSKAV